MRVFLLSVFLFTSAVYALCQDSTIVRKSGFDSTIKVIPTFAGRYKGIVYVASDNTPLLRRDIVERLMTYEPSAKEYARFKSARVGTWVWGGLAIVSCVISAANFNNTGSRMTFGGIAVGALIFEGINGVKSSNYFEKGIKLYNDHYRR